MGAGWRRRADTGSSPVVIVAALAITAILLGFFAGDTLESSPGTFVAIVAPAVLSIVFDALIRRRAPQARPAAHRPERRGPLATP